MQCIYQTRIQAGALPPRATPKKEREREREREKEREREREREREFGT